LPVVDWKLSLAWLLVGPFVGMTGMGGVIAVPLLEAADAPATI